ncbi:MAG: hypothetical protein ACKPBF_00415, partial [Actinomycetota bacterium]
VHPVLEHLAFGHRVRHDSPIMGTDAREDRQFLTAHENIDGINLQNANVGEQCLKSTRITTPILTTETLGG